MKFFEIPAVRTLLFSNMFDDLKDLGFKDGENMVAADIGNIDKQLRNLLADDVMIKEITENGYNFIRKNHTNEIRAKQFVEDLQSWL
jgi:spore maturation protein CgeB